MAFLTQWFPVGLIPEQALVAPMRDDVIDYRCRDDLSLRLTKSAERMLLQEDGPGGTQLRVMTLCSTWYSRITRQPCVDLFSSLLGIPEEEIVDIEILNPMQYMEAKESKLTVLDLKIHHLY